MYGATAHVYDLLYDALGKDYAAEAGEVAAEIRGRNPGARTLLDVACGTGRHLAHLQADHDFEVAGVDASPQMLEVARGRLPDGVELAVADMRTLELGRTFDAVACLFSSVGYAGAAADLDAAVARMAAHLAPGGVLVVDGWIRPDAWREPGVVLSLSARTDDLAVARVDRSWRDGARTDIEMQYLIGTRDGIEHLVEHHTLTLFTDDEYRAAFERAGLAVEHASASLPTRDRYVGWSTQ